MTSAPQFEWKSLKRVRELQNISESEGTRAGTDSTIPPRSDGVLGPFVCLQVALGNL